MYPSTLATALHPRERRSPRLDGVEQTGVHALGLSFRGRHAVLAWADVPSVFRALGRGRITTESTLMECRNGNGCRPDDGRHNEDCHISSMPAYPAPPLVAAPRGRPRCRTFEWLPAPRHLVHLVRTRTMYTHAL